MVEEDVNVEHLLDVFTTIDPGEGYIWDACYDFLEHLRWHKPRLTTLTPKIEALSDHHPSKPRCLRQLSLLLSQVGNYTEQKRLLIHALELVRRAGDDTQVAFTLRQLSDVNRNLGHFKEGIQQAREALEISKRIGDTNWQIQCSEDLTWLLFDDKQLDAAEEVASRAIDLALEKGDELFACRLHRVLGKIFQSKGEKTRAIHHLETATGIASPFNWHDVLFWIHFALASLFRDEGEFGDANTHIEQAKSHTVNDAYKLGRASQMQADIWRRQLRFEEARSEALHALEIYEKLGAARDARVCKEFLREVGWETK